MKIFVYVMSNDIGNLKNISTIVYTIHYISVQYITIQHTLIMYIFDSWTFLFLQNYGGLFVFLQTDRQKTVCCINAFSEYNAIIYL